MSEISDFTKLVLDRMETNPDEFVQIGGNYTRWQGLIQGLEELARNETNGRFIKVLWPLTDDERAMMLEKYRKIYLAELHKDMLKNIVSGNDKEMPRTKSYAYDSGNDINPLKASQYVGRGAHPNTIMTTADMKTQALNVLEDSFAKVTAEMEGAQIAPVKAKYRTFELSATQVHIAQKLGISPHEYARRLAQHEASDND